MRGGGPDERLDSEGAVPELKRSGERAVRRGCAREAPIAGGGGRTVKGAVPVKEWSGEPRLRAAGGGPGEGTALCGSTPVKEAARCGSIPVKEVARCGSGPVKETARRGSAREAPIAGKEPEAR